MENADNYLRYSMRPLGSHNRHNPHGRREKIRKELQKKPATGTVRASPSACRWLFSQELDDSNPIKTKEVSLKASEIVSCTWPPGPGFPP